MGFNHQDQTTFLTRRENALTLPEWALIAVFACGVIVSLLNAALPASIMVHSHAHAFADQRMLLGIPNAMDVLSNVPYAVLGLVGWFFLIRIKSLNGQSAAPSVFTAGLACLFTGLLFTAIGSSVYHLEPKQAWGLALDRAAMCVAFAGLLAWGSAHAVSRRSAVWVQAGVFVSGMIAVLAWYSCGAFLPWLVVQFGGLLVLCAMALTLLIQSSRAHAANKGFNNAVVGKVLGLIVLMYVVSKLLEDRDVWVFEHTQHWVSGHSLKHIVSACALIPLLRWLSQRVRAHDETDDDSASNSNSTPSYSSKQPLRFKLSKEVIWVRQQTQSIRRQLKRRSGTFLIAGL